MKKTILVTGGAGFIGSHLCERLVRDGHRVISLDNYFNGSKDNHVPGVEYREGHTKDIALLVPEWPDVVYHLGEFSRAEQSFDTPELVRDFNMVGTSAVLEYWRTHKTKLIYTASSTKFSEQGTGRDQSPYAWSKAVNSELVVQYGAWFGLPYAITYFCNVYGGREISEGPYATLVGVFKRLHNNGELLTVREPGTQLRNYTHIDDIVEGLVLVGDKGSGDGFVIAHPRAYSVVEVAKLFGGPVRMVPNRPGNRLDSVADTTKTQTLGWKPTHDLEVHIREFLATHIVPQKVLWKNSTYSS